MWFEEIDLVDLVVDQPGNYCDVGAMIFYCAGDLHKRQWLVGVCQELRSFEQEKVHG